VFSFLWCGYTLGEGRAAEEWPCFGRRELVRGGASADAWARKWLGVRQAGWDLVAFVAARRAWKKRGGRFNGKLRREGGHKLGVGCRGGLGLRLYRTSDAPGGTPRREGCVVTWGGTGSRGGTGIAVDGVSGARVTSAEGRSAGGFVFWWQSGVLGLELNDDALAILLNLLGIFFGEVGELFGGVWNCRKKNEGK